MFVGVFKSTDTHLDYVLYVLVMCLSVFRYNFVLNFQDLFVH